MKILEAVVGLMFVSWLVHKENGSCFSPDGTQGWFMKSSNFGYEGKSSIFHFKSS